MGGGAYETFLYNYREIAKNWSSINIAARHLIPAAHALGVVLAAFGFLHGDAADGTNVRCLLFFFFSPCSGHG